MRRGALILMLITILITVSGCDQLRSLVGLPTSKELATLAEEKRVAEAMRIQDSIREAEELATADSLKNIELQLAKEAEERAKLFASKRFHVILGSFKEPQNSERMLLRLKERGYQPIKMLFLNGFEVISVKGFDRIGAAYDLKIDLVSSGLAPDDTWIYDIRQQRHKLE